MKNRAKRILDEDVLDCMEYFESNDLRQKADDLEPYDDPNSWDTPDYMAPINGRWC